jgi:hypothetical protein
MQGILFIVFALIALTFGQSSLNRDAGGCCFYRKANFQDEIRCTSESFTILDVNKNIKGKETVNKDGIASFFCTERYSAAILSENDRLEELVDCGDVVNETTSAIPTVNVTVGECIQRRCCFYTGASKDGIEFCLNTDEAPVAELARVQTNGSFAVAECLEAWKVTGQTPEGKVVNVGCGETFDLEAKTVFTKLVTSPCAGARAVMESIDDTFGDEFAVDQAVADMDVAGEALEEQQVDQAVTEFSDDLAADFAEQQVDQAVSDQVADEVVFDENTADQAFGEEFVDQAVFDESFADANVDQLDQAVSDQVVDEVVFDENTADQAVFGDEFVDEESDFLVDEFADQAVSDDFVGDEFADQAVGDADIDPSFVEEGYDNAFTDESFSDFEADAFENY